MKAAQINDYGDASVVHVVDVEKPVVKPGSVLVEVHAASLNPFDTMVRAGYVKDAVQLPATLGGDVAGIIVEAGQGVQGFAPGDKVYGEANVVAGNSGAFAEFAVTAADQLGKMPSNVDFSEAASLSLVGVSALQAVTEHIKLVAGQKLFIHGGAGGIGNIAIQIAKNIGAYVATTAIGEGIQIAKNAGADQVIDYKSEDFSEVVKDYDAAFDTVGGDDFIKMFSVVKEGGTAVTMVAQTDESKAKERHITVIHQMTTATTAKLNALCSLVEDGVVTPHVGKVFPLSDVQAAFAARESGSVSGKIVLQITK